MHCPPAAKILLLADSEKERAQTVIFGTSSSLSSSKLAIHMIPGFATIEKNLAPAIDEGIDVVTDEEAAADGNDMGARRS